MFECCDDVGAGDKSLAFDCKKGLNGGGYCPPNDKEKCEKNYLDGVDIVTEYNREQAEILKAKLLEGDEESTDWFAAILIVLFSFGIVFGLGYVFYRTKCFSKPLC